MYDMATHSIKAIISSGILAENESNMEKTYDPVDVAKHKDITNMVPHTIPVKENHLQIMTAERYFSINFGNVVVVIV